ncbi:MAG: prepilin-type N-terminal cleavage/methylation domain-containing protein [Planctomycetaceae bacterium]|nr:prepilin-type N-terminal cleavage/methylation domain-containing protein [Planctomycetaceae bacterium]
MRNCQQIHSSRGMTLVELLVVMTIMVLLLAVSVPILRPMLESQKTHNAAQVLAGAFRQTRAKAMETGESYGVRIIPFATAPTAAVELRLHRKTVVRYRNPENIRVWVEDGVIVPYYYYNPNNQPVSEFDPWHRTDWQDDALPTPALNREFRRAKEHFEDGADKAGLIAFDVGTPFNFARSNGDYVLLDDDGEVFPLARFPDHGEEPSKYGIFMPEEGRFASAWLPPTVMPFGTIVDLAFSGGETENFYSDADDEVSNNVPAQFSAGDEIIVSFSPAGHVDFVYINGSPIKVNEMLYFCVGDWDRQLDSFGHILAEDGRSNLEMPATYWITLHPKTGTVRIAVNAPIRESENALRDARRFAREHFFDR